MKHDAFVPASDLTKLWRALIEFNMIEEGDKILIGLSGGKDSMFLTAALAEIQKHSPRHFDLLCYTMDGMFAEDFPKKELEDFCRTYGLTHYSDRECKGPMLLQSSRGSKCPGCQKECCRGCS